MKTEMLLSLQQRFEDIEHEESDILLVSTALDPRFKDKFFSREAKKFAKKCIVDHCISFEGEDNGPQTKRSRTISTQHDTASSSKIWECFTEILLYKILGQLQIKMKELRPWLISILPNL